MTAGAVRAHVVGLLEAIAWPYGNVGGETLSTFGYQPAGEPMGDLAIVLRMLDKDLRYATPRATVAGPPNGGLMQTTYQVYVMLNTTDAAPNDVTNRLDTLEAVVKSTLRQAPIDVTLTDPVTGETSSLKNIGSALAVVDDWIEDLSDEESGALHRAYRVLEVDVLEMEAHT